MIFDLRKDVTMKTKKAVVMAFVALITSFCVLMGVGAIRKDIEAQSGSEVFEMVDVYKLRLNGNGFAFTVKMNGIVKQSVNDNLYFLMAPKTLFDNCENDGNGYEWLIENADEDVIYSKVTAIYKKAEGGLTWYANCGLESIPEKDRNTKYGAVAVIQTEANGERFYRFADGLSVNDLYNIVSAGFYGGNDRAQIISAYGGWFGSSKYPIPVDNQSEYNALKAIAATDDGAAFVSGKKIAIDESVNRSDNALTQYTTNIITTYTVRWLDYDGTILEKDKYVKYGETPSYDGKLIKREGYSFNGWDKTVAPATKSVDYTAVYTEDQGDPAGNDKYELTVVNGSGGGRYSSGATVSITCDDDVDTETRLKTFVGWKKNGSNTIVSTSRTIRVVVTEDVTYTAVYTTEDWTEVLS